MASATENRASRSRTNTKKVHPEALREAQEKQHPRQGAEMLREKALTLQ